MEEKPGLFPLFNSFILAQRKGNDKAFPAILHGKTSQSMGKQANLRNFF